jgi:hydroxyethylthiazole kinase-like uncharacterized protein yjeF
MIEVRSVEEVRAAEEAAFTKVPAGALMQRAAHALAVSCARILHEAAGGVAGSRVVLLVGSGNNGGDALWAGQRLAARGCRVDAIALSDRLHEEGAGALVRSGGRIHRWAGDAGQHRLIADAHLVLDGILGIGGAGGLRPNAAEVADAALRSGAVIVAVDVPSGVDADTGQVAGTAIAADVTVTFGAVKPGLLLAPGRFHAGTVNLVDIGLEFDTRGDVMVLSGIDVDAWVPEPGEDDYKYRRGVAGVSAGSAAYPGACLLATEGARHGNAGMVRFLDRSDGTAAMVLDHFPDVVVDGAPPADQPRVTAWGCGSGYPGDAADELAVRAVLAAEVPVVLDAGALSLVAESSEIRAVVADRASRGLPTVLTPHEGEFERLVPGLLDAASGRLDAARSAAERLHATIVLKGPGTVVVDPAGPAAIDAEGTADLSTAGSGDVLMGILAALLAGAWARGAREPRLLTEAAAAAVWLHGRAGRKAATSGPVTALDIAAALPAAVRAARFGDTA